MKMSLKIWPLLLGLGLFGCEGNPAGSLDSGNFNAALLNQFFVSSIEPVAAKPGALVRVTGAGFSEGLSITIGDNESVDTVVASPELAVFSVPVGARGITEVAIALNGEVSFFPLIVDDGKDGPLFLGDGLNVCQGYKYLNADGEVRFGEKSCSDETDDAVPPSCTGDGQTGCLTSFDFPSGEAATIPERLLVGSVAAGLAGVVKPQQCEKPTDPVKPEFAVGGFLEQPLNVRIELQLNTASFTEKIELLPGSTAFQFQRTIQDGSLFEVMVNSQRGTPWPDCTMKNAARKIDGRPVKDVLVQCPGLERIEMNLLTGNLTLGSQYPMTVAGVFEGAIVRDLTSFVAWSVSPGSSLSFTGNVLNATNAETATVKAKFLDKEISQQVTVISRTVTSILMSPSTQLLQVGLKKQLSATAVYADGSHESVTAVADWSTANSGIAAVENSSGSKGLVEAVATGLTTVTASYGGKTATASITVNTATLDAIEISPAYASGAIGKSEQLKATAILSGIEASDVSSSAEWASSNASVATVGPTGIVTRKAAGFTDITVSYGGRTASARIVVTDVTLVGLTIEPATFNLVPGTSKQLKAVSTWSDGSTKDVTKEVFWSSANVGGVTVSNQEGSQGLAYAASSGPVAIIASYMGKAAQSSVSVTSPALKSISVSPGKILVARNEVVSFKATAIYAGGLTVDVTEQSVWTTSDDAKLAIDNSAGKRGQMTNLYRGTSYPTATVAAAFGGLTGTAAITMTAGSLTSIVLNPENITMQPGSEVQIRAYGVYDDGATIDLTSRAVFSVSDVSRAAISNATDTRGVLTGIADGTFDIEARVSSATWFVFGVQTFTTKIENAIISSDTPSALVYQGVGLKADYYNYAPNDRRDEKDGNCTPNCIPSNDIDVNPPKGSRLDSRINYDWVAGAAPLGVANDFAVRWTGRILFPTAGTYRLKTMTDDGVRVWLDGIIVIDHWTNHSVAPDYTAPFDVAAGEVKSFRMDFFENGGEAVAKLLWITPDLFEEVIPMRYLYDQ